MMQNMGKIYRGKPLNIKTRKELLATIKPAHWRHLRPDTGDVPENIPAAEPRSRLIEVRAV
jgi:hypothetical protein